MAIKSDDPRVQQLADAMLKAEARKRRMSPYTGELAKPIDYRQATLPAYPNQLMVIMEFQERERAARVPLAHAHVSSFQIPAEPTPRLKRGRPRKRVNALYLWMKAAETPNRGGRPRRWDDELLKALPVLADAWKAEARVQG